MNKSAKNELNSIISQMQSIVNDLNSIASGIQSDFNGIGNEKCAAAILDVADKYSYVKRQLRKID